MAEKSKPKRQHRATYARDKLKGGWIIRVEGPTANGFAGRDVPVTMMSGEEHTEKLETLLWTGNDNETGKPVALYSFIPTPREERDDAQLTF